MWCGLPAARQAQQGTGGEHPGKGGPKGSGRPCRMGPARHCLHPVPSRNGLRRARGSIEGPFPVPVQAKALIGAGQDAPDLGVQESLLIDTGPGGRIESAWGRRLHH